MIYNRVASELAVEDRTLVGVAIPYGQRSRMIKDRDGLYSETIAPGAFARSIEYQGSAWVFYHHDSRSNLPLGRLGANLSLRSADDGVRFSLELPNTTLGNDVLELLRSGILTGAVSASYNAAPDQIVWEGAGLGRHRRVLAGEFKELSIVPAGAFPQAVSSLSGSDSARWLERKWNLRRETSNVVA